MHNIGVKPGDPAADILFALAFYCFHDKLLRTLEEHDLADKVIVKGMLIQESDEMPQEVRLGAPPYTDDFVIPLSDESPSWLIHRMTQAAELLMRWRASLALSFNTG